MPTEFGHKLKPERGEKLLQKLAPVLLPGEEVLFVAKCNNLRPMTNHILITNFRIAGEDGNGISIEFPHKAELTVTPDCRKETVAVAGASGGSMLFKMVQREDHDPLMRALHSARSSTSVAQVADAYAAAAATPGAQSTARAQRAAAGLWPATQVVGSRLSSKASQAVLRQCHGEENPWLILVAPGGAGLLAAWDDRLAIIKTGALTGLMAGSLGGERCATFHFSDITGVEYNSGMISGVLEVLTASYSGTANRDFWRGSTASRNADSNDPYTLSNTLPLPKHDYQRCLPQVQELMQRIRKAKEPAIKAHSSPGVEPPKSGLASELKHLEELRDAGALTEEEFAMAKQKLLMA
jgi:hypothetical protein